MSHNLGAFVPIVLLHLRQTALLACVPPLLAQLYQNYGHVTCARWTTQRQPLCVRHVEVAELLQKEQGIEGNDACRATRFPRQSVSQAWRQLVPYLNVKRTMMMTAMTKAVCSGVL
jgi:hypothetical protein